MAGAAAAAPLRSPNPPPSPAASDPIPAASPAAAARRRWEVEFARFFSYPRRSASSPIPAILRPLAKRKMLQSKGTWLVASSPAVLRLVRAGAGAGGPVLTVSAAGSILEEHFVSTLHFSWPQVSCVSQCPVRGSRAVFLSFRDCSSQIQKFAVRFPSCCDAENFLNSVKECSRDTVDVAPTGSAIVCENTSPSDFIASNGRSYRFDEESSYERPIRAYAPEMPALTLDGEQTEAPLEPLLANNVENIFAGFPPSFTDLLTTNCSTGNEKERSMAREDSKPTFQTGDYLLDPSLENAAEQRKPSEMESWELKTQIVKYMSDASFHDMLYKIEKVIDELGGDLSL